MSQAVASANLQLAIVTGGDAAAELTCASVGGVSIGVNDEIVFAMEKAVTTEIMTDRTSAMSIPAAGKVACSAATNNDKLFVCWMAKDAAVAIASPKLVVGVVAAGMSPNETLTLTGIDENDELIAAFTINTTSGAFVDITATTTITGTDELTYPTGTDYPVLVFYWDKTGAVANASFCPVATLVTGTLSPGGTVAVTGITTEDEIICVLEFDSANATFVADLTATSSVSSDGYMAITGSTANANDLFILFNDRDA